MYEDSVSCQPLGCCQNSTQDSRAGVLVVVESDVSVMLLVEVELLLVELEVELTLALAPVLPFDRVLMPWHTVANYLW